jgi:UDP-glucose 4-epimerase
MFPISFSFLGYSVLEVVEAFEGACGRSIPYEIVDRRAGYHTKKLDRF